MFSKPILLTSVRVFYADKLPVRKTNTAIDDRTLHELYLWPFAEGVHAGVGSVMASYNAVRFYEVISSLVTLLIIS